MDEKKKINLEFTLEDSEKKSESPETPKSPKAKPTPSEKEKKGVEFEIPEHFDAKAPTVKKTPTVSYGANPVEIGRTYVPRFTEVSETYRMKGEPERTEKKKDVAPTVVKLDEVDPTAEAYSEPEDTKKVSMGTSESEVADIHTTVFKFEDTEEESVEIIEVRPEEPVAPEAPSVEIVEEPKEYKIPDPEEREDGGALVARVETALEIHENVGDEMSGKRGMLTEFTAQPQRDGIKDSFLDRIMSVKVRLIVSSVLLVALLLVENLWLFGVDIPKLLGIDLIPGSMALLDLHFIVALYALALPEVIKSFASLAKGRAVPELFLTAGAFVTILYSAVAAISAADESYPLYGMLFGILSVCAIASSLVRMMADFSAFKTVSSTLEKKVIDRKYTRTLDEEKLALDGKVEGYKSKIARIFRAGFISDFFKRCARGAENSKNVLLMLGATLGVSLVSGIVAFFVSDAGAFAGCSVFAIVFMLGIPAFSVMSHKIPFFHAGCEALSEDSAIIGESTLYDYAGVDVLTFRDTEVFTDEDITIQRIMLYGRSENLEKAMHQMSAIFSALGGPLENVFLEAIDRKAPRASNIRIDEDGILGEVGGCEVRAGSFEYMTRMGVIIPEEHGKETVPMTTKIMYAAENGEVYAKFYIRYTLSEEFTMLMPTLLDNGITPLIYTRDPNLTNELFRTLMAGADNVRILKQHTLGNPEDKVYARVSAGMVTTSDKMSVINLLLLAKRYVRLQSRLEITELTSMAVGSVLGIVLALTGMTVVPSLILGFWQIAWCAALHLMSKHTISLPPEQNGSGE